MFLKDWSSDIKSFSELDEFNINLFADEDRSVARKYGLIEPTYRDNFSGIPYPCRGLFIIDPDKILKMMSFHPWSVGRNTGEILRTIDSLQLTRQFHNKVLTYDISLLHSMYSVPNLDYPSKHVKNSISIKIGAF